MGIKLYYFGLQKYILMQDVVNPATQQGTLIMKNNTYFQDFKFAFLNEAPLNTILPEDLMRKVLNNEQV